MGLRSSLTLIAVLLAMTFSNLPLTAQTEDEAQKCAVSANYVEAVNENVATLLKMLDKVGPPNHAAHLISKN